MKIFVTKQTACDIHVVIPHKIFSDKKNCNKYFKKDRFSTVNTPVQYKMHYVYRV